MKRALAVLAFCAAAVAASPAQARRPWTQPTTVPGSDGAGYPYKVVLMRDGTAAVVFVRDGVRVALRSPLGAWGEARRVSTGHTAVATPDIATGASGELLVTWTQSRTTDVVPVGRNSVKLAIRSASGRWSAPHTVGATEHFVTGEPRLAANARGDAVLGWLGVSSRSSDARDVLRVAYRPAFGHFGAAHAFGQAGFDLRLVIGSRGGVFAAWSHLAPPSYLRSSVRLAKRTRRGPWSHAQTIAGRDAGGPQLALLPGGRLLIAWRGSERGIGALRTGIVTVAERAPGGLLSPREALSPAPSPGPQLAAGPSGEVLVVWNDTAAIEADPGVPSLFWTVGTAEPEGTSFAPVEARPGVGQGPLAMFGDGTAVMVWGSTTVHAVVRHPGETFGEDEIIARSGGFPVLAARRHRAVAVWLDGGRLVLARRRG